MALVAVFAVLGTVAAQRVSVAAAAPELATPEPASSALAPAPEPASPPEPGVATPEPGVATPEPIAVTPEPIAVTPEPPPGPVAVVKRTKPTSWATVQRAVKGKAQALSPCSEDEFISLGLRISRGRVVLETVDGAVVSPMSHPCVRDVVTRLTFPDGAELAGVVGVPLTD